MTSKSINNPSAPVGSDRKELVARIKAEGCKNQYREYTNKAYTVWEYDEDEINRIVTICEQHFNQDNWTSVDDELPKMEIREDVRGAGHWYESYKRVWVTNGLSVINTQFFQVWPDQARALSVGMGTVTHWMPYVIPSPPQDSDK